MIIKTKKYKVHISRIILSALFIVCLSLIFKGEILTINSLQAKAENPYYDVVTDNWDYFCNLEETYRNENPDVTYEEMVAYLEGKALEVEQDDVIVPVGGTIGGSSFSQTYNSLNDAEKALLKESPFDSLIVYIAAGKAREKTGEYYGNEDALYDNGDAFRHAYWNVLMTRRLGIDKAETFATAHEYGKTGIDSEMDLLNNQIGRNDGVTYSNLWGDKLAFKIMERVSEGNYWQIINQVFQGKVLIDGDLSETNEVGLLSKYATHTITLVWYDGMTDEITVRCGEQIVVDYAPYRTHYEFKGYYAEETNPNSTCYVRGVVRQTYNDHYRIEPESTNECWDKASDGVLYAHWELLETDYSITVVSVGDGYLDPRTISITSGQPITLNANTPSGYTFVSWNINDSRYTAVNVTYTFQLHRSYVNGNITIYNPNFIGSAAYSDGYISLYFQKNPEEEEDECIAAGTLITLADGRQVPVESLTGNEMLLVWNLHTGSFDIAPILFIDHDAATTYKIINLHFSDGTKVKVISEHAFWDFNLNKYVFLREDAAQYIGHWFNKQTTDINGNMIWTRVQLTNVTITEEYTTAWSPVTYGHLCIYVNGMLSMPGGTEGLINIFEVNGDTMKINQEQYLADIATYGLFTYEEFAEIYSIPEVMFEACGGEYLKVSIGKGLIDYEILGELIERYSEFFE